ncbi:hypothetical protein GCM10027048_40320 [Hymenobacter coalescens]
MFRTELSLRPAAQPLSQGARILTIGSCFSDVIGERLAGHKIRTLVNPFGTVFNPLAAARLLRAVAGEDTDWQQHLVEARGRWQSFDLHATVGADSPPALLECIEQMVRDTAEFIRTADVLIWTLGTAYGYRLRDTGEVVSNCHKIPAERFEKELLTAEEIVTAVTEAYALLRQLNPKLRLVLTVSPVRHLKDTLPLNAVSKSVLRVACHYLSELLPGASYFPAYELQLDDLRDYRFYAADMIHPSDVAEQYVWEKFTGTYFDASFRQFAQEWDGIRRALHHRPLHEGAPEHREFLEQTQKRLERLLSRGVDVRLELLEVQDRLDALPALPVPAEPEEGDDEERIDIGYEDATVPKPAKPFIEPAAVPAKAEPTWADILSAEAEQADAETDEYDSEEAAPVNEAEAALPGEGTSGKRRKRKRGGRKHKKKGNRPAGEEPVAGEDATETGEEETPAVDQRAAEPLTLLPEGAPQSVFESVEPGATALPPVELPAVDEPLPVPGPKRRNRPNRKKPALYAAQTASPELPATAEVPVPESSAPAEPASPLTSVEPAEAVAAVVVDAPALPALPPIEAPALEPVTAVEPTPKAPTRRPARGGRAANKVTQTLEAAAEAGPTSSAEAAPVADSSPEAAPTVTETAAPPAAPRRRAPRRKPAAPAPAAEPAPAPPVPDAAASATPKRRSRPPRRKPDDTSADS